MVPSRVIAHECIAILSTPLLAPSWTKSAAATEWCGALLHRLTHRLGWKVPQIRSQRINLSSAPALYRRLMRGETITLERLLRSPADRSMALDCAVLYLDRDDDDHRDDARPDEDPPRRRMLFAGTRRALGTST